MNISCHIEYVCKKISTVIVFLYNVGNFLANASKTIVYTRFCVVLQLFSYIVVLYGATDTGIGGINMFQNSVSRIIFFKNE